MKYAITGHTEGIGKALFDRLQPDVIGFSRSNGFDISKVENRRSIIEHSRDCDVFINNAHHGFDQIFLLIELFREWKDLDKTIINVGSRVADIILPPDRLDLLEYQSQKVSLRDMSVKLIGKCKIKYRTFSYVGTEKILKKYPNIKNFISVEEAVNIILS